MIESVEIGGATAIQLTRTRTLLAAVGFIRSCQHTTRPYQWQRIFIARASCPQDEEQAVRPRLKHLAAQTHVNRAAQQGQAPIQLQFNKKLSIYAAQSVLASYVVR